MMAFPSEGAPLRLRPKPAFSLGGGQHRVQERPRLFWQRLSREPFPETGPRSRPARTGCK